MSCNNRSYTAIYNIQISHIQTYTYIYINHKKMSTKKQQNIQTSSLSTFTHTQNSQATKKAISTQQISMQSQTSQLERISSHHNIILPFQINIKSLIKHLLFKLEEKGTIVLYSDQQEGQILVQKKIKKNCFTSFLDCLCICKKQGWPKGSITQSFQAASILVIRQFIQHRCRVKVRTNCPREKASPNLVAFIDETVQLIKKCLQTYKDTQQEYPRIQISDESPLAMQIAANQKAYELFISNRCQDQRFKVLFNTSLQKLKSMIKTYKKQSQSQSQLQPQHLQQIQSPDKLPSTSLTPSSKRSNTKKHSLKPSSFIQVIIGQSDNIFQFCRQLNMVNIPHFHHDYALYAIEGLFCYYQFKEIFQIYKKQTLKQCEMFQKNSEYIVKNLSTKQYFDYLQVRNKFRLKSTSQPYDLAINALRQLQSSLNLRQCLLSIQNTFSLIKVCCLYQHDGKLDISSMDDILPVMIYVVAKAQVTDFPVYVKIIDDYIKTRGIFQLQQRVITTLYVAAQDICKKVPEIKNND